MNAQKNNGRLFPIWIGVISILPSVLLAIGIYDFSLPWAPLATPAILIAVLVAVWYCIVGFREGFRWMAFWITLFLFFLPIGIIAFWVVNRKKVHVERSS